MAMSFRLRSPALLPPVSAAKVAASVAGAPPAQPPPVRWAAPLGRLGRVAYVACGSNGYHRCWEHCLFKSKRQLAGGQTQRIPVLL